MRFTSMYLDTRIRIYPTKKLHFVKSVDSQFLNADFCFWKNRKKSRDLAMIAAVTEKT